MTAQAPPPTSAPPGGAILCILGSCLSLQFGAALAVQLFPHAGTWATASLRLVIAALILFAASRPKFWRWSRAQWRGVVLLGLSLGFMNGFFYAGIARIPLGTAVTIEFLGPLLLAAILSRSVRDGISVGVAMVGMLLLAIDSYTGQPLDGLGVVFTLAAGFFWALYILANKHAGTLVPGQGGLAVALAIGGLAIMPFGTRGIGVILGDTSLLLVAVGTAILASLIPYSLELIAVRQLKPNVFAIFISLEPAFAAAVGWLVLGEAISALKFTAIVLVIAASVNQTLAGRQARKVARTRTA